MSKVGRKSTYDPQKLDAIVTSVVTAKGSLGQVADLNHIPRDTFYFWLRCGEEDRINNLSTDLAQLSSNLRKAQADVVIDLAEVGLNSYRKSKFIIWWLSKICREDFGEDSEEIKKLKDLVFNQLLPLLQKGDLNHGSKTKEMDSESN